MNRIAEETDPPLWKFSKRGAFFVFWKWNKLKLKIKIQEKKKKKCRPLDLFSHWRLPELLERGGFYVAAPFYVDLKILNVTPF